MPRCIPRWLPQQDREEGRRKLWGVYENARALPTHMIGMWGGAKAVHPMEIVQRLGTSDRQVMLRHLEAGFGTVRWVRGRSYGGVT